MASHAAVSQGSDYPRFDFDSDVWRLDRFSVSQNGGRTVAILDSVKSLHPVRNVRRTLVREVNAPLLPEAKKI